jgi:phage/plasmid primase-like uncharacterized protein
MPQSNENRLMEDAQRVATEATAEIQGQIDSVVRTSQNVPSLPATQVVPPNTWGQDWFFIGLVSVGLLGLAYIVLKKD